MVEREKMEIREVQNFSSLSLLFFTSLCSFSFNYSFSHPVSNAFSGRCFAPLSHQITLTRTFPLLSHPLLFSSLSSSFSHLLSSSSRPISSTAFSSDFLPVLLSLLSFPILIILLGGRARKTSREGKKVFPHPM